MSVGLRHMFDQIDEAERFLNLVFRPGDLVEIRGLRKAPNAVMGGLFSDFNLAARAAALLSSNGANVYYTLNPVDPKSNYASLVTGAGQINVALRSSKVTASDKDIQRRNLILFDADPERGEKGTCSTDIEKALALDLAETLEAHLRTLGFPDPILVDSGSGWHLLYKADGPIDDPSLKAVTKLISEQFSTPFAKIDRVVFNPARIARLPGFLNMKGANTSDRPHRLAKLVRVPAVIEVTPADKLVAILGDHRTTPTLSTLRIRNTPVRTHQRSAPRSTLNCIRDPSQRKMVLDYEGVMQLLQEYPDQLRCDRTKRTENGTIYVSLASCPFKGAPHQGQDVGGGKTCIIWNPDFIGFKCFSDDCADHSFGSLLTLLRQKTGRPFSRRVWEQTAIGGLTKRPSNMLEGMERTHCLSSAETENDPSSTSTTIDDTFDLILPYLVSHVVEVHATLESETEIASHKAFVDRITSTRDVNLAYNYLAFAFPSEVSRLLVNSIANERQVESTGYITQIASIPEHALTQLRSHSEREMSKAESDYFGRIELEYAELTPSRGTPTGGAYEDNVAITPREMSRTFAMECAI